MSNNVSSGDGTGFFGVLLIVFVILKLTGNITWSWWLVLAPMWAPAAIVMTVFLVMGALAVWNKR